MKEAKIKNRLFAVIFIMLFAPLIQHHLSIVDSGPLKGYYTNARDDTFSWQKWFDGSYQKKKNDYNNDHTGFRPDLLRIYWQMEYSLFKKINSGGTPIGRDNYLFYQDYIDAYNGIDFVGYRVLQEKMIKLKAVSDTLKRLGKSLVMVYAPCKAWYYSEYIPPDMKAKIPGPNNYKTCFRIGDSLGIDQIDFNAWFLSLKDTTRELLYSKQGIHWTMYGSLLACDSLIRHIERLRHIHMDHPRWNDVEHTTTARGTDDDVASSLNLIFPIATDTFCYPELYITSDSGAVKPNAIYIGDSYVFNFISWWVVPQVNTDWQYWVNFKYMVNFDNYFSGMDGTLIKNYNWKDQLLKADYIVLLYTPKNIKLIGNGFIEQAYDYYYPKK